MASNRQLLHKLSKGGKKSHLVFLRSPVILTHQLDSIRFSQQRYSWRLEDQVTVKMLQGYFFLLFLNIFLHFSSVIQRITAFIQLLKMCFADDADQQIS